MKYFKVKMRGVCYFLVSKGKHGLEQIIKPTSNQMVIC